MSLQADSLRQAPSDHGEAVCTGVVRNRQRSGSHQQGPRQEALCQDALPAGHLRAAAGF